MKNKVDENPSNPRWGFLKGVPFRTLITQHQDQLSLRYIGENDMVSIKEKNCLSISCWIYYTSLIEEIEDP